MNRLRDLLDYNQAFVENKEFEEFKASKFPDKKMVVISCMDTRLTELLPRAMNLKNGDAKFIKDAGAIVAHPFGSVMRSVIVAVYELGAEEVYVIAHHGCGMASINPKVTLEKMRDRGVQDTTIATLSHAGVDLERWLHGFGDVAESVKGSVDVVRNHPLLPPDVPVHGLVIDPETGKLDLIVNGWEHMDKK